MAEAIQVPVSGGNIPPIPNQGGNPGLPPENMQPGFVQPPAIPPQPTGGFTQAQVDAQVAAALAAAKAPQAPAPIVPSPEFQSNAQSDPVLASLTDIFLKVGNGIDIDRAIGNALSLGRADLIDTAYIRERGGVNAEQLVSVAQGLVQRVQSQTAEAVGAVYQTAGDKASWDAAAAAFNNSAPAHLKMVIAQMLESGNPEAVRAAAKNVVDYSRQNGLVANPGQFLNAGATSGAGSQALSKAEFQAELRKLDPNSPSFTEQRNTLFAGRMLGKQLNK